MTAYTAEQFIADWENTELNERASAQSHFEALCRLMEHPLPYEKDPKGEFFTFEYGLQKSSGRQGFADVFYKGHFAIEYKGKGKYKDLGEAYQQLLRYRENLFNPPLLVVCDIAYWEIHTNFPNTEKKVYKFTNADIAKPHVRRWLHHLFYHPEALHPERNTEQVTKDAAQVFQRITDNMRDWQADPDRIAHFLTKLVFCLFAEDVELLPNYPNSGRGIFSGIVEQTRTNPLQFKRYLGELFKAMADGGDVLMQPIPYFNGKLFEDVDVEDLSYEALDELAKAATLDWSAIEPAIFGTLFERSLDPSKRAQLGAHYTSRDDILLIVEPVLMQPLRREWEAVRTEAAKLRAEYEQVDTPRAKLNRQNALLALRETMLKRLREIKVLDPACGSGNFLYVSLNLLLDMEKAVIHDPLFAGLQAPFPEVHPRQLYGMELDPIAHALASIVVWIGYIQWRRNNGYLFRKEPILEQIGDNIRRMDAILRVESEKGKGTSESGQPSDVSHQEKPGEGEEVPSAYKRRGGADTAVHEPEWAVVDVIVGNPPFLGGKRMRSELGDDYVDRLFRLYESRVPHEGDLVTYWFEKARAQIEQGKAKRAGLLSTNSIRGGANREVLKRIKGTGDIFMAWSDRDWILDGAAVRVSMVGFDDGQEITRSLDGQAVNIVNADLTASVDITTAKGLSENANLGFMGITPTGRFVLNGDSVRKMVTAKNEHNEVLNEDVLKPFFNGLDVTRKPSDTWIVDFTALNSLDEANKYVLPMQHVIKNVKPFRDAHKTQKLRQQWWRYEASRPAMRQALTHLQRYIVTPTVAKHRVFVWLDKSIIPDHQLIVFAREDDYFFGVLHSKIHEVWSLRKGTWLGKGNDPRYTPTTTFETFPFPWKPGDEPKEADGEPDSDPLSAFGKWQAVGEAAKRLHEERDAWLKGGKDRTLTDVYNAVNVFRGKEKIRVKPASGDFAPRLSELHDALDAAVCLAYGWALAVLNDEESILRGLLQLNGERAGG